MTTRVSFTTGPGGEWKYEDFDTYEQADKRADELLELFPEGCAVVDLTGMIEAMQKNGDLP